MFDKLERLREKPEAYRMKIAFITAASIAGVIFLIWLSVIGVRFNNKAEISRENELFAEVKQGFSGVFKTGKSQFDEVKRKIDIMQ